MNNANKGKSSKARLVVALAPIMLVVAVIAAVAPRSGMAKIDHDGSFRPMSDGGSDYAVSCVRCHGGDGRSQTAKGRQTHSPDLTKSRISDAKGIRMITNGGGSMPAFKDSLNAEQIQDLMAYIHGFRQ